MIKTMEQAERDAALHVADIMAAAARTAPKGSGKDKIVTAILTGEEQMTLSKVMTEAGTEFGEAFFLRDAKNVADSHCILMVGAISDPFGFMENCSMCGFENCVEMTKAGANCAFNITDLGIAVGSAVSVAADHRIDNRVMYSAGKSFLRMEIFPEDVKVCYGIPLYTGSKSIYFDRGPGAVLK
ncbi:putative ferredoxin-like protein [Clostridiales Family XIII bacterium PM5-7]